MEKRVILIAGVDYPHLPYESIKDKTSKLSVVRRKESNWRKCAFRLAKLAFGKFGKRTIVTLFDFDYGFKETLTLDEGGNVTSGNKRPEPDTGKTLGQLDRRNYRIVYQPSPDSGPEEVQLKHFKEGDVYRRDQAVGVTYFTGIENVHGGGDIFAYEYLDAWLQWFNKPKSGTLPKKSISIVDVYRFIQDVGRDSKKSGQAGPVCELHFLSHAFWNGPILVNTNDWLHYYTERRTDGKAKRLNPKTSMPLVDLAREGERDPFDKDCRGNKDFTTAFKKEDIENFVAAFSDSPTVFVWGCFLDYFSKELIRQTNLQGGALAAKKGDKIFNYKYTDYWNMTEEAWKKKIKKPKWTGQELLDFLDDERRDSFAQRLANCIKKPVIGALPGTSSDPDSNDVPSEILLWSVGQTKRSESVRLNPSNFTEWLAFYKTAFGELEFDKHYLGAKFKSQFGRGFSVFKPD